MPNQTVSHGGSRKVLDTVMCPELLPSRSSQHNDPLLQSQKSKRRFEEHGDGSQSPPAAKKLKKMQKFRKKVAEGGAYEDRNEGGPDRKLNSDLRFVERHLLQTDKNTLKMGEAMCKSHLALFFDFFLREDQFMDRIEFCKKSIVKRLEIELPLMDTAFVENMAHTISIIYEHAAKDGDLMMGIKRHIDSWIMHQVVRLHCMGELDEHAYQALKVCPPVAASTIYRHLVLGENVRSQSKPKGNQKIAPKTLNTAVSAQHIFRNRKTKASDWNGADAVACALFDG